MQLPAWYPGLYPGLPKPLILNGSSDVAEANKEDFHSGTCAPNYLTRFPFCLGLSRRV